MTLGPAFGAPPPSDFNEPHDLHHEPGPIEPDAGREPAPSPAATDAPDASPDQAASADKPGGVRGWLSRLFGGG